MYFCNAIVDAVSLLETKYGLGDNESLHLSPCKAKPRQDAQYLDRGKGFSRFFVTNYYYYYYYYGVTVQNLSIDTPTSESLELVLYISINIFSDFCGRNF